MKQIRDALNISRRSRRVNKEVLRESNFSFDVGVPFKSLETSE